MFSAINQQNQGFSKQQLRELRVDLKKDMSDYFVKAFQEVMTPYMEVQQQRWDENERVHNAILSDLHRMNAKLDAFIDRSAQHDDRLYDHEKRISHLETITIS